MWLIGSKVAILTRRVFLPDRIKAHVVELDAFFVVFCCCSCMNMSVFYWMGSRIVG